MSTHRLMTQTRILVAWTIVATVAFVSTVNAETVTLPPLKDNTLYEPDADKSNGSGRYIFAGNTDGAGVRRAVLAFDIAGSVPSGVTIESASLTLHMSRTIAGAGASGSTSGASKRWQDRIRDNRRSFQPRFKGRCGGR